MLFDKDFYPEIKQTCNDTNLLILTLKFLDKIEVDASKVNSLLGKYDLTKQHYREAVLSFYERQCFICEYSNFIDIHHIIPVSKGGSDRIDNLVVLCSNHHKEWHYIENTFKYHTGGIKDINDRSLKVMNMAWQIPDFIMNNNISPFLIQLARKVNR